MDGSSPAEPGTFMPRGSSVSKLSINKARRYMPAPLRGKACRYVSKPLRGKVRCLYAGRLGPRLLVAGGGLEAGLFAFGFGELFLARGVGLLDGALGVDAVERVGALAADGADLSADGLDEERLGLFGVHGVFTLWS